MRIKFESGCEIRSEKVVGQERGYYLVREHDGQRFFISKVVDASALERVCKTALSEKTGLGYWIDLSLGLDTSGAPAWVNLDQTDRFI